MQRMMGPSLEIARIQSEINRLFESLLELNQPGDSSEPTWTPNSDIIEGPETVILSIELPGVQNQDLEVQADGGNIIVRGAKKPRLSEGEIAETHCSERSFGKFQRVIALNYPINTHRAEARLHEGVLKIVFPKVENRRGGAVTIPVQET